MNIPESLNGMKVFYGEEASDLIGLADVGLPEIEYLKTEIEGGGILGKYEAPLVGHTGPMKLSLGFGTITKKHFVFLKPIQHPIVIMGSLQQIDRQAGTRTSGSIRIDILGSTMKGTLGKLKVGDKTDSPIEFDVTRIKIKMSGEEVLLIDKLNSVFEINGEDILAEVNANIGN